MKEARERDLYRVFGAPLHKQFRRWGSVNAAIEAEELGLNDPDPLAHASFARGTGPVFVAKYTLRVVEHGEKTWPEDSATAQEQSAAGKLLWNAARRCIEAGQTPPLRVVAKALVLAEVPEDLRHTVAGMLLGKMKRRPGPDPVSPFFNAILPSSLARHRAAWVYRVARYWRVYKSPRYARERQREAARRSARSKPPRWNARSMAFEAVAEEAGLSVRQLETWYYWKP